MTLEEEQELLEAKQAYEIQKAIAEEYAAKLARLEVIFTDMTRDFNHRMSDIRNAMK
jgi:hypothetical protein